MSSCSLIPRELPSHVALRDMEEPLIWYDEPDDEAAREQLDAGCFSGLVLVDARESLEAMLGEPEGLLVESIIENSPAHAAGIEAGDLLFEAKAGDGFVPLGWPSDWRAIELDSEPGSTISIVLDRAGAEFELDLKLVKRIGPSERAVIERYEEDERVGVVLRTATEVEARAAGLAPGGGAVIVGLSGSSPWRNAGLQFGDLITSIDGIEVAHPRVVIDHLRDADVDDEPTLLILRDAGSLEVETELTERDSRTHELSIPLLVSYENDGDERSFSMILGLIHWRATDAAWRFRLLWFIGFGRGDSDLLEEVDG
ncbi:MAG: C-terminal processing protease CtpA/Prc [Planctomycetota bacterium]